MFHGNGGYSWDVVYNMPIWLRKYTFQEIQKYYQERKEAEEEARNKAKGVEKAKPTGPPKIKPSYTTKASTK